MEPIQKILARIAWDRLFGAAEFQVGYYDRLAKRIVVVPLAALRLEKNERFLFYLLDPEGVERAIPFHRIRELYRDGVLVWHRPPPAGS